MKRCEKPKSTAEDGPFEGLCRRFHQAHLRSSRLPLLAALGAALVLRRPTYQELLPPKIQVAQGIQLIRPLHPIGFPASKCEFWLAYYDPFIMGRQICVCRQDQWKMRRIESLASLKGLVSIRTPQEALQFVRLATNQSFTLSMKPLYGFEVVSQDSINLQYALGDSQTLAWLKSWKANGMKGVVDDTTARILHAKPHVFLHHGSFIVSRLLMLPRSAEPLPDTVFPLGRLARVREFVGTDGAYKVESIHYLKPTRIRFRFNDMF